MVFGDELSGITRRIREFLFSHSFGPGGKLQFTVLPKAL
jgi:hypothetical protein